MLQLTAIVTYLEHNVGHLDHSIMMSVGEESSRVPVSDELEVNADYVSAR